MIAEMENIAAWALAHAHSTYETNLAAEVAELEQRRAEVEGAGEVAPATEMAQMYFALSPAGIAQARAELEAAGEFEPLSSPTSRIGGLPVRCDTALDVDWQLRSETAQ